MKKSLLIFLSSAVAALANAQGFLEMPDITEVPDMERETMVKDLDVPAVRDRDPDPQGGPRLNVTEFRVQGIVEYPELGITREEIIKRVEAIRFEMMQEDQRTRSGFSLDELEEIGQLFVVMEKNTLDRHVGPLEVQKFVFLVRDQLRRRGMTLGMIETVADTITNYYRERGFMLAKAYIPKQKVRDGVVNLTLLLGELASVDVEDNKRVSPKLIQKAFKHDIHKPVTHARVEEALHLVNDIPGVQAQGYFSPGEQVGDTRVTVKVAEEKWASANLRLDNHGSENTSENRAYADIYLHNPLGWGDELYLAVLNTYDPDKSTYGAIRYNSFILSPRWRGSVGYSTNEFFSRNVRQDTAPTIEGESEVSDASLSYHFRRSRVKNHAIKLEYMDIDTLIDLADAPTTEVVKQVSLTYDFDLLNDRRRELYIGTIGLYATESESSDSFVDNSVDEGKYFIRGELTTLSFLTIPFTKYTTRILSKSALQYAGKPLSSLTKISLTGPSRARGFGVNGLQTDDGVYLGADWIFSLPKFGGANLFGTSIEKVVQPYLFADAAMGVIHPVVDSDGKKTGKLANVGVGLKLSLGKLSGSLAFANVVKDDVEILQGETPPKDMTFEVQYQF